MAKSLSSILTQIERLQKEAAAIQSEIVNRIRKEIAQFGLTAEDLFGEVPQKRGRQTKAVVAKKPKNAKVKTVKYADGAGNTWGGIGKRPDWIRQALDAGKALGDFLVGAAPAAGKPKKAATAVKKTIAKPAAKVKAAPARKRTKAPANKVASELAAPAAKPARKAHSKPAKASAAAAAT